MTIAIYAATLIVSKLLHRSVNILVEGYAVHLDYASCVLVGDLEECLEMSLLMLAIYNLVRRARPT